MLTRQEAYAKLVNGKARARQYRGSVADASALVNIVVLKLARARESAIPARAQLRGGLHSCAMLRFYELDDTGS